MREALLELSYEGLVSVTPRSGITVLGITPEDAVDNFAVLATLSGKAAEWATERITGPERAELHALAAAVVHADDVVAANWSFHRALNRASGSPRLMTYLRQAVRVVPASYFELFPEQVRRSRADHAVLLEAIDRGDAAAARALTESHVLDAGAALGDWLRAQDRAETEERAPEPDPAVGPAPAQPAAATARRARTRKPSSFSSAVRTRVLRDMVDTSWPAARRRSAPTVASSLAMREKGSNEYHRMAFSWVILAMSPSGTAFFVNSASSSSGASGHIESLWG